MKASSGKNTNTITSPLRLLPDNHPLKNLPSAVVDCRFDEKREGHVIKNKEEAKVLISVVKQLLDCGVQSRQIGIITFYAAQAEELKHLRHALFMALCSQRRLTHAQAEAQSQALICSTVDGFQGDERDIILISCVRTVRSVGFLTDP